MKNQTSNKNQKSMNQENTHHKNKDTLLKKKILQTGYDYYAILGFNNLTQKDKSKLSHKDINKAYIKKLKKYHPDRVPKDTNQEEKKQLNIMYKLIQEAGDILLDKNKRKAYDLETSVTSSDGYLNQKNTFEKFIELQTNNVTEEGKSKAKLEFEKEFNAMNNKHNLNKYSAIPLTKDDTNRRLEDLMQQRDIDDIEIKPSRIFEEGEVFDKKKFMKAFGKNKLKEGKSDELVKYDNISAFNDNSTVFRNNMVFGCNDNYGDLYREDEFKGNNLYGNVDDNSDDDLEIDSVESDNIDNVYLQDGDTAMNSNDLSNALDELVKKRDGEDDMYANTSYSGYKSAINDKFGPSNSLGFMVGSDYKGEQIKRKTTKQLDSEIEAYKKMIDYEEDETKSNDSYEIDV
jgi:curved DNA-binding protein CbpA